MSNNQPFVDPYYGRPEVSNSDLSELGKMLYGRDCIDPTEAYAFGSLLDAMITEPERIDYLHELFDGSPAKDFKRARKMAEVFLNDKSVATLIQGCDFQKISIKRREFKVGPLRFELDCRCKWDFFGQHISGDIKTTTATSQKQFDAACQFFDYDRQRAWYMDLEGRDVDVLIGISKVNFKIFKRVIRKGDAFYNRGVEKYTELAYKYWAIM